MNNKRYHINSKTGAIEESIENRFIFTDCEWHGKEKSEIILTAVDPVTNEFYESRIQSLYLDWKKVED